MICINSFEVFIESYNEKITTGEDEGAARIELSSAQQPVCMYIYLCIRVGHDDLGQGRTGLLEEIQNETSIQVN